MRSEINLGSASCQPAVAGSPAGNTVRTSEPADGGDGIRTPDVAASCRDQQAGSLRYPKVLG